MLGLDDQRPYYKNWKKTDELNVLSNFLANEAKVVEEFKRSIKLMMRVK